MSGLPILDLVIGIAFVYLLLALICTTVNEMIAGLLKSRAKVLDRGIQLMLRDPGLKSQLYRHPLIQSLSSKETTSCPSYIPANKFAAALMDIVTGPDRSASDTTALVQGILKTGSKDFQEALAAVLQLNPKDPKVDTFLASLPAPKTPADPARAAQARIESWFNDAMDRVSGSYKRQAQARALLLAVIVTLLTNADTKHIAGTLWTNPAVRAAVIEEAKVRAEKEPPQDLPLVEYPDPNDPDKAVLVKAPESQALSEQERKLLGQLTGWDNDLAERERKKMTPGAWICYLIQTHWLGWLATILAVSQGAPFWFDVLNKFMNIRNTGKPPKENGKEKEK